MFEIFINNFIALATMLIALTIIAVIFIGILFLCLEYVNYCIDCIKNIYLRCFALLIVPPLTISFLVGLVLSIFGVSLTN